MASIEVGTPIEETEYAKEYGVSLEEAERRLHRIDELDAVLEVIAKDESARLAGWGILHEPQFAGWVYLTGDEPAKSSSLERAAGDEEILIEYGAERTYAELEAALASLDTTRDLPEELGELVTATGINPRTNRAYIGVEPGSLNERVGRSDLTVGESILDVLNPLGESPLFEIVEHKRSVKNAGMEAGQALGVNNSSGTLVGYCTTGFGVHRNGTKGFLTAGHCRDGGRVLDNHWDGRSVTNLGTFAADVTVMRNTVNSRSGDAMWYSIDNGPPNFHTVTDGFWKNASTRKDVLKVTPRANMYGHYVCMWGASSGASCGTVVDTSFNPDNCGFRDCFNVWIKATGSNIDACGQDSGGPTFRYRRAYGIHTISDNGLCSGVQTWMGFMAADYVEDLLDVTILLS